MNCSLRHLALAWSIVLAGTCAAQTFPDKPVRLILPTGAGGTTDQLTRVIAERLSERWKQPVVVDNRPGAMGTIAARFVATAPADGYIAMVASTQLLQSIVTMPDIPFKLDDFAAVRQIATVSVVMVARNDLPCRNLAEFIAYAKSAPKPLSYGTDGVGGSKHVYGEILKQDAKFPMLHVSYKTETQELSDLMGGFVDAAILGTPSATPMIRAGRVRALAVIGDKRSSQLAEVPTFPELGYKRLNRLGWFGVLVPAATPPTRIAEFSSAMDAVLAEFAVAAKVREMGFVLFPSSSPAEFDEVIRSDLAAWRQLIHDARIQTQ